MPIAYSLDIKLFSQFHTRRINFMYAAKLHKVCNFAYRTQSLLYYGGQHCFVTGWSKIMLIVPPVHRVARCAKSVNCANCVEDSCGYPIFSLLKNIKSVVSVCFCLSPLTNCCLHMWGKPSYSPFLRDPHPPLIIDEGGGGVIFQ